MKNRTDFVRVGWKEQLWQAVCNQMEAAKAVLWVLFGFVVGLGNMMNGDSRLLVLLCVRQFRKAICFQLHLVQQQGSLLLSNLSQIGRDPHLYYKICCGSGDYYGSAPGISALQGRRRKAVSADAL